MPELANITSNTIPSAVEITGAFELQVEADADWGDTPLAAAIDIEISEADTAAEYAKTGLQLRKNGTRTASNSSPATRYVRCVPTNVANADITINYLQ